MAGEAAQAAETAPTGVGALPDEVALTDWECAGCAAGRFTEPHELTSGDLEWLPLQVPGVVGQALLAAGRRADGNVTDGNVVDGSAADGSLMDGGDWWFRCRVGPPGWEGPTLLRFGGIATIADAWLGDRHLLRTENMFVPADVELDANEISGDVDLVVRVSSLTAAVHGRRPRPRWKTRLVADQGVRWARTSLIGRIPGWAPGPAPVGPWQPVTLQPADRLRVMWRELSVAMDGAVADRGLVRVRARLAGIRDADIGIVLEVGSQHTAMTVVRDGNHVEVTAELAVEGVRRWWPHSHGEQPRYEAALRVGEERLTLGHLGFRDVAVDRSDGGFRLLVNGVEVFARGACWLPVDPVSLRSTEAETRRSLQALRDAGMNMVRVTGVGVYESEAFWDACDELGLMVWHDLMTADLDLPDDAGFAAAMSEEVRHVARGWQGRPSLTVVCGSSETEQQATYFGLSLRSLGIPVLDHVVPDVLAEVLPGVTYLTSTPTGGALPTRLAEGVTHYFGVGGYRRPLTDVRLAGVRFAAECLAFASPPEPHVVRRQFGPGRLDPADPRWRRGVPGDNGAAWDFEDVRDHYVAAVFGLDPTLLRTSDIDRYLDVGRAAVAEACAAVFTEWRRPGSHCSGGLVLTARDLYPGPGWGLLDSDGGPKAPLWVLRPLLAPLAVLVADRGLDGVVVHLVNDAAEAVPGVLHVERADTSGHVLDTGVVDVVVPGRGGVTLDVEAVLDGFRDLNGAHGFGEPVLATLSVVLTDRSGVTVAEAVHVLPGPGLPLQDDVGLSATVTRASDGWQLDVSCRWAAERVAIDLEHHQPVDSWFTLPAGASRTVRLVPTGPDDVPPSGEVRALNSLRRAEVVLHRDVDAAGAVEAAR